MLPVRPGTFSSFAAISVKESNAHDDVVPVVATATIGTCPSAISLCTASRSAEGFREKFSSAVVGITQKWPIPNTMHAFLMIAWAWSLANTTMSSRRGCGRPRTAYSCCLRVRAARKATMAASPAEPWMTLPPAQYHTTPQPLQHSTAQHSTAVTPHHKIRRNITLAPPVYIYCKQKGKVSVWFFNTQTKMNIRICQCHFLTRMWREIEKLVRKIQEFGQPVQHHYFQLCARGAGNPVEAHHIKASTHQLTLQHSQRRTV